MLSAMDNYRKTYDALLPEINANIEKYRKGHFAIRVVDNTGAPVTAKVSAEQKRHLFDFGTSALMIGNMGRKEQEYRDAVSNLFNLITTTFCWGIMETEPGKYRFEEGCEEIYRRPPSDRVLQFAKAHHMKAKGQPLFCDRWCPGWSSSDPDVLKTQWLNYVEKVARRYDGEYSLFDVVNESFLAQRRTPQLPWLSDGAFEYVKWTLKNAGEIFSENCLMERNETTHVNYGLFGLRYYEENKALLEEGIRLDSIGFQFHYFTGEKILGDHLSNGQASLREIYAQYHKMSSLGIPMYITEITIPTVYQGLTLAEGENIQAEILEKLYRLWFSIPNMQGIIYWNLKDGDAWRNEGDCLGCLTDQYLRKKKSYYAIEHLIKREWNTCITAETDDSGTLVFSGFYGTYDISVEVNGQTATKCDVAFDKNTGTITIVI